MSAPIHSPMMGANQLYYPPNRELRSQVGALIWVFTSRKRMSSFRTVTVCKPKQQTFVKQCFSQYSPFLQMCNLLQYFCDRELQHRVEAIIAFSERHMDSLQTNQRQRYKELMQAFTMSAAETARRTREFRSPPQEQVILKCFNLLISNWRLISKYIYICAAPQIIYHI